MKLSELLGLFFRGSRLFRSGSCEISPEGSASAKESYIILKGYVDAARNFGELSESVDDDDAGVDPELNLTVDYVKGNHAQWRET